MVGVLGNVVDVDSVVVEDETGIAGVESVRSEKAPIFVVAAV